MKPKSKNHKKNREQQAVNPSSEPVSGSQHKKANKRNSNSKPKSVPTKSKPVSTTMPSPSTVPSESAIVTRAMEAGKRQFDGMGDNSENKKHISDHKAQTTEGSGEHEGDKEPPVDPLDPVAISNHMALVISKLEKIENNTASLNQEFQDLSAKVDGHSHRLESVEGIARQQKQDLSSLAKQQASMTEEVDKNVGEQMHSFRELIKKDNEQFRAEIINFSNKKITEVAGEIEEKRMEDQCASRKSNLIIVGCKEAEGEETDMGLVQSLFSKTLGVQGVDIGLLYRMGKSGGNGPRPIMVKFVRPAQRNDVWFAKSKLKEQQDDNSKIWLEEDLPKKIKDAQKTLYFTFKKAKSMKDSFASVQLKGSKLLLDGQAYGVDDMDNLPVSLRPASLATVSSESAVVFFGKASPLSNHHPSPFMLEGQRFANMEQYLAWSRATIAGRQDLSNKALRSSNPVTCKTILRELRQANTEKWNEEVQDIVLTGLRAKCRQNPQIASFLRETHPKRLGEASYDKRWGIGLSLSSPHVLNTSKWADGGNLLGSSLSSVRDELIAEFLETQ